MTSTERPGTTRGRLTRVTLSGASRRADLVLPSDEALGLLVPDLVAMVGGRPGADPGGYQLTTVDGTALDLAASLRDAGVPDGALVRLDPVAGAPPAPILHDVSDHVSDGVDGLSGRWDAAALRATATAVTGAGALVAALAAVPSTGPLVLLVTGAVAAAAGAIAATAAGPVTAAPGTSGGRRAGGVAVLLAGATVVLVAVTSAVVSVPLRVMAWAAVVVVVVAVLGAVTGHRRAGLIGSGSLLLHLLLWWGLGIAGVVAVQAVAVIAVVAIGMLGLLPRLAVTASGLAGLDDRQSADEPVTRVAADVAVRAAHRGLVLACVATAASGGMAGWVLAAAGDGWATALAAVTAGALLLRLRAFPLTAEVVALVGAGLAVATGMLLRLTLDHPDLWWAAVIAALAVAAVAVGLLVHRPSPHGRARARQLADRVEGLAVIAAIPLAVGVFGVYQRLLETF